ncbi:MAG: PilZ domain-containing protein [Pseudomonadales bacterium]|nr:PilZ domain-containing protein [Pseudomonadales bacterium]
MSIENRAFMRNTSSALVEMRHASFGSMTVRARDLSDGGISVDLRQHIAPPVGTILDVIISRHTGALNVEPVKMEVRHIQSSGLVGLKFV